jgi:hypothetical protein
MSGTEVAARIGFHEGALYALEREGRPTGVLFTVAEGARRYAEIVRAVEGTALAVREVAHEAVVGFLRDLAWYDAEVMVDPEYVAGQGPIAAAASAHVTLRLLPRRFAAAS